MTDANPHFWRIEDDQLVISEIIVDKKTRRPVLSRLPRAHSKTCVFERGKTEPHQADFVFNTDQVFSLNLLRLQVAAVDKKGDVFLPQPGVVLSRLVKLKVFDPGYNRWISEDLPLTNVNASDPNDLVWTPATASLFSRGSVLQVSAHIVGRLMRPEA